EDLGEVYLHVDVFIHHRANADNQGSHTCKLAAKFRWKHSNSVSTSSSVNPTSTVPSVTVKISVGMTRPPMMSGAFKLFTLRYCSATKIGINPCPDANAPIALPITAPKACAGSTAFIAWPGSFEVVNRSPTSMGERLASTLQKTLPINAIG